MTIDDLFAERSIASTPAVAAFVGISETAAREWAEANGVSRAGNAYGWTPDDVLALAGDVDDDDDDLEEFEEDE